MCESGAVCRKVLLIAKEHWQVLRQVEKDHTPGGNAKLNASPPQFPNMFGFIETMIG
jgi:hypothetical protein